MTLQFDSEFKEHLKILVSASPQVLVDFCKLALDFMKNGPNVKRYEIAAEKLDTSPKVIEDAVTGLVKLLVDACKYNVNQGEFSESVTKVGFGEEQQEVLSQWWEARGTQLRSTLSSLTYHPPSYRDLHWRLQTQVASRYVPTPSNPKVIMELQLQTALTPSNQDTEETMTENFQNILLQSDLSNIVNLTNQLETALRESKTFNIRRMQRLLDQ